MRASCRWYLTLSSFWVIVRSEWRPNYDIHKSLDDHIDIAGDLLKTDVLPGSLRISEDKIHEHSVRSKESNRRFADVGRGFDHRVPEDFAREISRLKIPHDGDDIPKLLRDEEDDDRFGDDDEFEGRTRGDDEEEEAVSEDEENVDDEERDDDSERDDRSENEEEESNEESDERRRPPYDDYDGNEIHGGNSKEPERRPHVVNYEVTETIPFDTKQQRPRGPVYPLPPPCPGAPPPTFPPPPTSPKPTVFPPAPPVPPKSFYHDDVHPQTFTASHFPSSSFKKQHFSGHHHFLDAPRSSHIGNSRHRTSRRFPRRASPQRIIIRYHTPAAYVVRKVRPASYHPHRAEPVIVRHVQRHPHHHPAHRPKEVHIHHHHDNGRVIHVHKNDEDDALEEAKFTSELASLKLFSESEFESAKSEPFAEPSIDFDTKKKRKRKTNGDRHIHTS